MDEKREEEFVTAVEQTATSFGARSYEEGLDQAIALLCRLQYFAESIRTKDALRSVLRSTEVPTKKEERIILFFIRHAHQFVKIVCESGFDKFMTALPAFAPGRPHAVDAENTEKLLDFIYDLHRKRVPLTTAKLRASQLFNCSIRTVERLCAARRQKREDCATPEELSDWISKHI